MGYTIGLNATAYAFHYCNCFHFSVLFTFVTLWVLQTEAGLVSFCHFGAVKAVEVIECEHLHAVIVPTHKTTETHSHKTSIQALQLEYSFFHFAFKKLRSYIQYSSLCESLESIKSWTKRLFSLCWSAVCSCCHSDLFRPRHVERCYLLNSANINPSSSQSKPQKWGTFPALF